MKYREKQSVSQERFIRVKQIVKPDGILEIGKSTWWKGVREQRFPQPTRIGGCTFWKQSEVIEFAERGSLAQLGRPTLTTSSLDRG